MPGITQTEAFKNAERLERAIVTLGELADWIAEGNDVSTADRVLREVAASLRTVLEKAGLQRLLQLGHIESIKGLRSEAESAKRLQASFRELDQPQERQQVNATELQGIGAEVEEKIAALMRDFNVDEDEEDDSGR